MTRRLWVLGLVAVLMLALAACGGGGEGGGESAEQPAAPAGDPDAGKQVFLNTGGCGACHTIEGVSGAAGQVGPELTHIASVAAERAKEAGVDGAEAYVRQSILEPNAYVVKECPTGDCVAGTMPNNFKDILPEQQINDLVAFLMQQQ